VADTVEAPVILAKADCCPAKAPSLIRNPLGDKEASLASKGKDSKSVLPLGAVEVGLNSSVSKSEVVHALFGKQHHITTHSIILYTSFFLKKNIYILNHSLFILYYLLFK
jgi:hypothetical protein